MLGKVYVINAREGVDYSKAEEHGEVVLISPGVAPLDLDVIKNTAQDIANEFDPIYDRILFTPSMTCSVFMCYFSAFYSEYHSKLPVLIYDARVSKYHPRVLALTNDLFSED